MEIGKKAFAFAALDNYANSIRIFRPAEHAALGSGAIKKITVLK